MQDPAFRSDLFSDRVVFITGGGTGIGLGISQAFAAHGAHVVMASRKAEHLEPAVAAIRESGGAASFHELDVRDAPRVEEVCQAVCDEHGKVDVVVNNAAGNFIVPFLEMSENAWNAVVGIVLGGTVNVSRAFGRRMIDAGGVVLNIVAGYAWTGAPWVSHSGAAKAGVLNLTKSLAVEWAPKVRVNAISPGPIEDTEGAYRLMEQTGMLEQVRKGIPLDRFGRAEDIAQAALFLASPAAAFVTGACLVVDGGEDARGKIPTSFG